MIDPQIEAVYRLFHPATDEGRVPDSGPLYKMIVDAFNFETGGAPRKSGTAAEQAFLALQHLANFGSAMQRTSREALRLPPLTAPAVNEYIAFIKSLGRNLHTETIATLIAAFRFESRRIRGAPREPIEAAQFAEFNAMVQVEMMAYAARTQAPPALDELRAEAEFLKEAVAIQRAEISKLASQKEALIGGWANAKSAVENETAKMKKQVGALQTEIATDLANWQKGVRQELDLDKVRLLWDSRAKESSSAFKASSWLIALLIVGPIAFLFWNRESLKSEIASLAVNASFEDAVSSLPYLVLISLPIFLLVWAIRLVVRFNARSLVLQDDARQRHTIMNTYLHLVEKGPADRVEALAIALEALFRRTPGHGPETIEPPNLTDIIKIGNTTGGSN